MSRTHKINTAFLKRLTAKSKITFTNAVTFRVFSSYITYIACFKSLFRALSRCPYNKKHEIKVIYKILLRETT